MVLITAISFRTLNMSVPNVLFVRRAAKWCFFFWLRQISLSLAGNECVFFCTLESLLTIKKRVKKGGGFLLQACVNCTNKTLCDQCTGSVQCHFMFLQNSFM